jgi:hypothetical protein
MKGVKTNERSWWIWTSYRFYTGSLYSVSHYSFYLHNLIRSLLWIECNQVSQSVKMSFTKGTFYSSG